MKVYRKRRGILPLILNLGTSMVATGQIHALEIYSQEAELATGNRKFSCLGGESNPGLSIP
jgi:hypothetical protein